MLEGLIRWVSPISLPEPAQSGETVSVIVVDPEIGLIDRAEMGRTAAGIDHILGGAAVPLLNAPGGDIVYGKAQEDGWRWKKDDCVFGGRCVIVGSDATNTPAEPVANVRVLRRDVRFGPPGKTVWLGYDKHPMRMTARPSACP
ncbi:hypothetical protein ACQ86E_31520 [Bradyrhizobium betae]|uniref:hypothetical protein n=1 Tax=Bradyrhizobium betae TaxID=244734 RepID=UPI003D670656